MLLLFITIVLIIIVPNDYILFRTLTMLLLSLMQPAVLQVQMPLLGNARRPFKTLYQRQQSIVQYKMSHRDIRSK